MVHINIDRLTEGILIHTIHTCINRLWNVCKQIDYTHVHLRTAGMHSCHTLWSPMTLPMNDGRSESEDGWHQRASLHLCHSANPSLLSSIASLCFSPDTPSKPSSSLCVSRSLFPFPVCLLSSMRSIYFSLPLPLTLLCLVLILKYGNLVVYVFNFCCVTYSGGRSIQILK